PERRREALGHHHRAGPGRDPGRRGLRPGLPQSRRGAGLHGPGRRLSDMADGALLEVRGLHAWYGESHVLHGVDFEVRTGEVVTLLGRNGAGKTTTLKSIMGIVGHRRGSVKFGAQELIDRPSNAIARLGLAFCPEEPGIFP